MNDLFNCVDVEDLRVLVWSLYYELKNRQYSCFFEFFCVQFVYNRLFKILFNELEVNKKIYISKFSEGS